MQKKLLIIKKITYDEETYLLNTITRIRNETHENNIVLKQIIKVINTYIAHHNQENSNDFDRNVLANLINSGLDFGKLLKRS